MSEQCLLYQTVSYIIISFKRIWLYSQLKWSLLQLARRSVCWMTCVTWLLCGWNVVCVVAEPLFHTGLLPEMLQRKASMACWCDELYQSIISEDWPLLSVLLVSAILVTVAYLCLEWINSLAFPFLQLDRCWPVQVSLFVRTAVSSTRGITEVCSYTLRQVELHATYIILRLSLYRPSLVEHSLVISINLMLSYLLECRFGNYIVQCFSVCRGEYKYGETS